MERERAKVALHDTTKTSVMVAQTEVRFVRCQIFGGHDEPHRRSSQQETILIGKV